MDAWEFDGVESIKWLIEHPLPIFLCIILKSEARMLVYNTTPRFYSWVFPNKKERLVLKPGTATDAKSANWQESENFDLEAPILNFTITQMLDSEFHATIKNVLSYWINIDLENIFRIKCGIPSLQLPYKYASNKIGDGGIIVQTGPFREDLLALSLVRLKEILGVLTINYFQNEDLLTATLLAMALLQVAPRYVPFQINWHHGPLHSKLNEIRHARPGCYAYEACYELIRIIESEITVNLSDI